MPRDMMPSFDLLQPATLDDALAQMKEYGADAWPIAGGKDSLNWFKDRIKRPKAVIDLTGLSELHGVREVDGGLEIGALTTLTEVEHDPKIREMFGLLSEAVSHVASPQIRNAGTIAGNISQDTRCLYYQQGVPCYRAGGNSCFADTPKGMNREHALFGASRCVAVSPSDSAPVMVALEAQMVLNKAGSQRVVNAEDFFIGPEIDIQTMTATAPDEIVTAIRLPAKWAGAKFFFEKVTDRATWDFPLVNVASVAKISGGKFDDMRIVCGAVACKPYRLPAVEELVKGQPADADIAKIAGQSASRGATPLNFNHFKIPLMENLVNRAVRSYVA